jgi:hypothetical protein
VISQAREKLKIDELFPDVESGDEEVIDAGWRSLRAADGLRTALFAGDKHFGDGSGLGVGKAPVHFAEEIAAKRDQKENAQAAAREADEDGLNRMRIELQDVERGKGEDGASDNGAGESADAGDDYASRIVERRG